MMPTLRQGDLKQLYRWSVIDALFRTGLSFTAQELCDYVNSEITLNSILNKNGKLATVSKRTINSDLKDMQLIFGKKIEIIEKSSRYKYYNPKASIFSFTVSLEQELSFYLLLDFAKDKMNSDEYGRIRSFINEICAKPKHQEEIYDLNNHYILSSNSTVNEKKWIDKLYESIVTKKALKLYYKKYGQKTSERELSVYGLKEYNGAWYFVAYEFSSKKIKVFKLDNILAIEKSDYDYHIENSFSITNYFEYSLGVYHHSTSEPITVTLEVNGNESIDRIEQNPIHHSQQVTSRENDKIIINFSVYNTPELIHKIFDLGPNVKILGPGELIKEYKNTLNKILSSYTPDN